jgi:HK97 family phage major capsid protein
VNSTNSARIAYVDQVSPDGTAATVAEGAGKPQIDVDYKVSYSSAVKVAAYTKISDEMLDDIDFMAQAVADELISRVRIAVSGNIYTYITSGMTPGYTEVDADFLDYFVLAKQATIWDVLTAAKATIEQGNHQANTVFVTPTIFATMNMVKNADASYTQPVLVTPTMMSFNGMNIYSSNAVADDKYIVCDINKLNVSIYKDLIVEAGWETADFINNLRTFRGEGRFHYYVKDNDKTAFLYGDLSTSVAYMTAAA